MASAKVPYLCGGIFFTMILQAIKPRTKARDKKKGGSDGLSDTDVMEGLIKAVTGNDVITTQGETFRKDTTCFKTCKEYGATYIPFTKPSVISAFTSAAKQKSPDLLKRMSEFINKYIDESLSEWLVKTLIEVIQEDDEIDADTAFSVTYTETITKQNLDSVTDVELPIFLMSVLCFILNERKDNTKGRATFEEWHSHAGPRSPWKFKSDIGNSMARKISVQTKMNINYGDSVSTEDTKELVTEPINVPEEQPSAENQYSPDDRDLLQDLNEDYDEILTALISENYGAVLLDMKMPQKISELYKSKWKTKADSFTDPILKSYVFALLGELNNISQSFFNDDRPAPRFLKSSRAKIRNLYIKLHPDSYDTAFPYDVFIDDWNDGEY